MRFALSTNWNSSRHQTGEAIADEALELGFDALELGFRLMPEHAAGIKRRLDSMPVDSVHAYSPVPLSAPYGHPELHSLASLDPDERALAQALLRKTIEFAGSMGAKVVVLHAGRVKLRGWFHDFSSKVFKDSVEGEGDARKLDRESPRYVKLLEKALAFRHRHGVRLIPILCEELEKLMPDLEKHDLVLGLENLPYFEAFPVEDELEEIAKKYPRVKAWYDTGHARVRASFGWSPSEPEVLARQLPYVVGCHINDVIDFDDDHFAPGKGRVDFAALKALADPALLHVVEPHASVTKEDLASGLARIRDLWS